MKLVIDASVAIKWLYPEPGSREARDLITAGTELLAPSLLPIEIANVLWRLVRTKKLTRPQAERALSLLVKAFPGFEDSKPLLPRALTLAMGIDHPVYDCIYIALAERESAVLMTDDRRLLSAGSKLKGITIKALGP